MTISGLFNTYFFFLVFSSSLRFVEKWEIRNKRYKRLPLLPAVTAIKDPHSEFLDQICGSFSLLFLLLLLWVSDWMSEWVFLRCSHDRQLCQPTQNLRERETEARESEVLSSARERVCMCEALHLLTPIHAYWQQTLTLTHTRYALNIRSLLCSAAAPIEIVACAAVELSVQFEQRYRAVWRPLSLCKQNVFAFKVSKSSSNNL